MLKYYDVINKLSDEDKIKILSDISALSDIKFKALGIPSVKAVGMDELRANDYPKLSMLANTWNLPLVGRVSEDIACRAADADAGLMYVEGPRTAVNPYRTYLSEDPLLASLISKEYMRSAERVGISSALTGFGLHRDELEWLDGAPNKRFLAEYTVRPYQKAASGVKCAAAVTEPDISGSPFDGINTKLSDSVYEGKSLNGLTPLVSFKEAEKTVSFMSRKGVFLECSASALTSALSRYKTLSQGIESGKVSAEVLDEEISDGRAISPEAIDEAVDRTIDLAHKVKRFPVPFTRTADKSLAMNALRESAVLLKNENAILPLKSGARVALIGDIAMTADENGKSVMTECIDSLNSKGYCVIGKERGYDMSSDDDNSLLHSACELAKNADVILVFLGCGEARERMSVRAKKVSVPANQQMLLDNLAPYKDKVVAILPSAADIGVYENTSAILLEAFDVKYGAQVLTEILSGDVSPSGRLANTLYTETEKKYVEYKTRRVRDGMKVGPFTGYRYYCTSGDKTEFPFGHGLGYAEFAYSALSVTGDRATLTVKNTGNCFSVETVQLYVGKNGSSVLRPRMELAGFTRVGLGAGESKTVEISFEIPQIYREETNSFVTENGEYTVYVGASSIDIRLKSQISVSGDAVKPDGEKLSDYIYSESNIINDNFKLEANFKGMKKSWFNFIAGAAAFILAVVLKLFCVSAAVTESFFDWFALILCVMGIAFFIAEGIKRNRIYAENKKAKEKNNVKEFEDAEHVDFYNAPKMFMTEFETTSNATEDEEKERVEENDSEYFAYVDKKCTFDMLAEDFEKYAARNGIKLRRDDSKKIFSSLASSRLLITNGMEDKAFQNLIFLLSGYLESSYHLDKEDASYISAENVLFRADGYGGRVKTNAYIALDRAKNAPHQIHVAAISDVKCGNLPRYFTPYVNYAKHPLERTAVSAVNDRNVETSYYIPQNLWFILNISKDDKISNLPEYICEVATVLDIAFEECKRSETPEALKGKLNYHQLDHLTERTGAAVSVDEKYWKNIDRIEEYANKFTSFKIGNRQWLGFERYTYVYAACGGEIDEAVGEAVAAKLVASLTVALKGKAEANEDGLIEAIEKAIGEDYSESARKLIAGGSKELS